MVFKPPINQDLAATPHARWLEDRVGEYGDRLTRLERDLARMSLAGSTSASQTNAVNIAAHRALVLAESTFGLPSGGETDDVLAKASDIDGDAEWRPNTVGGLPADYFTLSTGGTTIVDLGPMGVARAVNISITPASDGDDFVLEFPIMHDFGKDLDLPFFVLTIAVYDHAADVTVSGAGVVPTYADHPAVFINGSDSVWTLPANFYGVWWVFPSYDAGKMVALPLIDPYHSARFGTAVGAGAAPSVTATAAAGTGPTVTVTGTSTGGVVELITGTSPTTTGWGELLTFNDPVWVAGTVPVLALYPANQAAAALTHYATRSGTDAEAHFDLTGLAASTTYKFHYSLLPFAAV